jgi:hypothetical protein
MNNKYTYQLVFEKFSDPGRTITTLIVLDEPAQVGDNYILSCVVVTVERRSINLMTGDKTLYCKEDVS